MIIYHQKHLAGFAGAHTYWFLPNQKIVTRVAVAAGAPSNTTIEQARSIQRFVFSRVWGRVN